jgi:hypothetical protein
MNSAMARTLALGNGWGTESCDEFGIELDVEWVMTKMKLGGFKRHLPIKLSQGLKSFLNSF